MTPWGGPQPLCEPYPEVSQGIVPVSRDTSWRPPSDPLRQICTKWVQMTPMAMILKPDCVISHKGKTRTYSQGARIFFWG